MLGLRPAIRNYRPVNSEILDLPCSIFPIHPHKPDMAVANDLSVCFFFL